MSNDGTLGFAGYTFADTKGCRACNHVLDGAPVLMFVHENDGSLQFLCGANGHTEADASWVHASHVLATNPDLTDLPTVDFGFEAEREGMGKEWLVRASPEEV
ncbi:MAG: hypothetical protein KKC14_03015 [Alphaproteobacteria bacterium]|nr:hypothetical protein [Alphaproteobacteria bacterium]